VEAMPIFLHLFSGFVIALPASIFWILVSQSTGSEYFWKTYIMISTAFLATSFLFGFFFPAIVPAHWKRHPIAWSLSLGFLAWLVAILALGLINLTPLCVGQENGDGRNDIALCILQSVMVSIVFSPLEFFLLSLTAVPGGWLIKRLVTSEDT